MNYIQQINGFEQWAEVNMPSTGQYALYYALLAINNRAGWKEWFKVANSTLEIRIGMTPQGIRKARSKLIEHGLIEIQIVGSNKATMYKIKEFTSGIVSANNSTSGIVSATVSAQEVLPPEKFPLQFPVLKDKQDIKTETKEKTAFEGYTSNPTLIETLKSFVEFRKSIKKKMTDKAIALLLSKLDKLSSDDSEKVAILEQSIFNNWQGIFALKEEPKGGIPRGNKETAARHNVITMEQLNKQEAERLERSRAERMSQI